MGILNSLKGKIIKQQWLQNKKFVRIVIVNLALLFVLYFTYLFVNYEELPKEGLCTQNVDYSVSIHVTSAMGRFYDGEIVIKNLRNSSLDNWKMHFSMEDHISCLRDGVIFEEEGEYCITGTDFSDTCSIPARGEIVIPIRAEGYSRNIQVKYLCTKDPLPEKVEVGYTYDVQGENCNIHATVTSLSEQDYTLQLSIINKTGGTLCDYGLMFPTKDSIGEVISANNVETKSEIHLMTATKPEELSNNEKWVIEYRATYEESLHLPTNFSLKEIISNGIYKTDAYMARYIQGFLGSYGEIVMIIYDDLDGNGTEHHSFCDIMVDRAEFNTSEYCVVFMLDGIMDDEVQCSFLYMIPANANTSESGEFIFFYSRGEYEVVNYQGECIYKNNRIEIFYHEGMDYQTAEQVANAMDAVVVGCIGDETYTIEFCKPMDDESVEQ